MQKESSLAGRTPPTSAVASTGHHSDRHLGVQVVLNSPHVSHASPAMTMCHSSMRPCVCSDRSQRLTPVRWLLCPALNWPPSVCPAGHQDRGRRPSRSSSCGPQQATAAAEKSSRTPSSTILSCHRPQFCFCRRCLSGQTGSLLLLVALLDERNSPDNYDCRTTTTLAMRPPPPSPRLPAPTTCRQYRHMSNLAARGFKLHAIVLRC